MEPTGASFSPLPSACPAHYHSTTVPYATGITFNTGAARDWSQRKEGRDGVKFNAMRPHTLHILCSSFWPNTAPLSCSSRHTHQISHCDFFLFPRLKKVLKGHRFEATEDIKRNSTKTLLDIPKEEFAKCFQQWEQRWAKFVAAEGNYVEDN